MLKRQARNDGGGAHRGESLLRSWSYSSMDIDAILALDRAFDRLVEAADELGVAHLLATQAEEERLASEVQVLAHAVSAEIDAAHAAIRRALTE